MRDVMYCTGVNDCINLTVIVEKGVLVFLLTLGVIVGVMFAAIILYHAYKVFIVLSDSIGAYIFRLWRKRMYLKLAWIVVGLLGMYFLGYYWYKGLVPFIFFWFVVYSFMLGPKRLFLRKRKAK